MGTYFKTNGLTVNDGTTAKGEHLNDVVYSIDASFDQVDIDLKNIPLLSAAYAETDNFVQVEDGTYSSKHYSNIAEQWAVGVPVDNAGTPTGDLSAKAHAEDAADQVDLAAGQVALAEEQVSLASDQVALAAGQVTLAEGQADLAEKWAEETPSVEVEPGKYSAKHWSVQSESHANNAEASALTALSVANSLQIDKVEKLIASGTDVQNVFLYDTTKDPDGGAWRLKTAWTSWYNETLYTGDRGYVREFPVKALIISEPNKLSIYDATDPDLKMWMVFNTGSSYPNSYALGATAEVKTKVKMLSGVLAVGSTNGGIRIINFPADTIHQGTTSNYDQWSQGISTRNTSGLWVVRAWSFYIPSDYINDIDMTILDPSVVDDVSGIPIPTIAVATTGGIGVLNAKKGTSTYDNTYAWDVYSCSFTEDKDIFITRTSAPDVAYIRNYGASGRYTYELYSSSSIPDLEIDYNAGSVDASGPVTAFAKQSSGFTLLKRNELKPTGGMVNRITSEYATGWMPGDNRLATLCDTTEGTVGVDPPDLTELATGWTNYTTEPYETFTTDGKDITSAINSSNVAYASSNNLYLDVGKTYKLVVDLTLNSGETPGIQPGKSTGIDASPEFEQKLVAGRNTIIWTKVDSTHDYLWIHNKYLGAADLGNWSAVISVTEVTADVDDRSTKGNQLYVNGQLTKTAVNTGAELVGFSGFTTDNFIEQPSNSDNGFGTNSFHAMAWVKLNTIGGTQLVMGSWDEGPTYFAGWDLRITETGLPGATVGSTAVYLTSYGVSAIPLNRWVHLMVVKDMDTRTLKMYQNGVLIAERTLITGDYDVGTTDPLQIGKVSNVGVPLNGSITLARAGFGAPSDDDIRFIYEQEKALFTENAKCTLNGTSDSIRGVEYDSGTGKYYVGDTDGVGTEFDGLRNTGRSLTWVGQSRSGAARSFSAQDGLLAMSDVTGAYFWYPEINLRETISKVVYRDTGCTKIYSTYLARDNYLINGDFQVWQRGASQVSSGMLTDDRWTNYQQTSAMQHDRVAFPIGQTEVPGNPRYFSRMTFTTGGTTGSFVAKRQDVMDVTRLAGKKVIVSFYARANTQLSFGLEVVQSFGAGGSATISELNTTKLVLGTSWKRYEVLMQIPGIEGKVLGTTSGYTEFLFWYEAGSTYDSRSGGVGNQSGIIDLAMAKVEDAPYSLATYWDAKRYEDALWDCLPYYEKSEASEYVLLHPLYGTDFAGGDSQLRGVSIRFQRNKVKTPTIATNGLTGTIVQYKGTTGFSVSVSDVASGTQLSISNWTADADS